MDLVSLGFLFVIVLGGGASAFAADSLGWRIGKRRHSMFGMRPKHFARLVVTVTGALIPFFTILVLASLSAGVRVWILRGSQAIAELPGVIQERDQAQRDLDNAKRQAASLRGQNAISAGQLRAQETLLKSQETRLQAQMAQLKTQTERIKTLAPRIATLTGTLRLRQSDVKRLTSANRQVRNSLTDAQTTLADARTNLSKIKGEFRVIKAETRVAKQERDTARSDRKTAVNEYTDIQKRNVQLTAQNNQLESSIATLTAQVTQLNAAAQEARQASETARADLAALQVQVQGLQSARDQLQDELDETRYVAGQILGDAQQARTLAPTFRARDELARLVIPAGASVDDARALVNGVLRLARIEAEKRGAAPTRPGVLPSMRAADLPERNLDGRPIGASEQIDRLAAQLAGRKTDSVLVARSVLNFFVGEAVALNLVVLPDPVVFRAGEVIAEGPLDSRRGDAGVYAQINEFLGTRVQGRAREAKLIPIRVNGEETFGEIPPEQILQTIRIAGEEQRRYRLQAVAVGDIRAGDRLKIELRLR